jgi:branched-chain amino acid transport system substrate-binding protein
MSATLFPRRPYHFYAIFSAGIFALALSACSSALMTPVRPQPPVSIPTDMPETRPVTKVGLLIPLSGKDSRLGEAMQNAASLAVSDLGDPYFEVTFADTESTPAGAASAATVAINDNAKLLLGPIFADEARAVQSAVATVPILPFSTDTSVAKENSTFIMGVLPQDQARHIAHFAATRDARNTLIIAQNDAYGQVMVHAFSLAARQLGRTVTGPIWASSPDTLSAQITAAITQAGGRAIDSVFLPLPPDRANQTLALLRPFFADRSVTILGAGLWEDADITTYPALAGGFYAGPSPAARDRFEQRYTQQFGETPPRLASLAYDATALAITINRTMGAAGFSPRTLTHSNGFSGMNGLFRFGTNGVIERSLSIIQITPSGQLMTIPAAQSFR